MQAGKTRGFQEVKERVRAGGHSWCKGISKCDGMPAESSRQKSDIPKVVVL